jgi:hypothetical protein
MRDPISIYRLGVIEQREREAEAAQYRMGRSTQFQTRASSTTRRLVLALGSMGAASLMIAQLVN